MSLEEFHKTALPWIRQGVKKEDVDTMLIAELLQKRCEILSDIPEQIDFIDVLPEYSTEMYTHKKMKTNDETSLAILKEVLPLFEGLNDYSLDGVNEAVFGFIKEKEYKNGYALWPIRCAVSGKQFTPGGATEIASLLGKEETISRIKKGIELLTK